MSNQRENVAAPGGAGRALRGTATYASANVIQRAISFLLLPLYARVLTPTEYGQLGIIVTIAAAVGAVVGLGLETAVFRSMIALATTPLERKRYLNTVGGFALVVPTLLALILAIPIGLIGQAAFNLPVPSVILGVIGAGLTATIAVVPFAVLRAEERLGDYLRVSSVQAALGIVLSVAFVLVFRWGVPGWLLASALSSAIVIVWGIVIVGHRWTFDVDRADLRSALAFGLPMIPHALSHWALAISDRAILGLYVLPSVVGVYFMAFQLTIPITVLSISVSQSVQPLFAHAARDHGVRHELRRITTHQALIVAWLVMATVLLGPPVITLLLPASYHGATELLPWLAVGAGLFGLYLIPMNAVTIMSGRNRWVWIVTVTAALTNVGLNLIFVPTYGALAAAIDTVVGYGLLLVGVYIYMRMVVEEPLSLEWERLALGMGLIAATIAGIHLATPQGSTVQDLIIRGLAVGIVGLVLSLTGLLPDITKLGRIRTDPSSRAA